MIQRVYAICYLQLYDDTASFSLVLMSHMVGRRELFPVVVIHSANCNQITSSCVVQYMGGPHAAFRPWAVLTSP